MWKSYWGTKAFRAGADCLLMTPCTFSISQSETFNNYEKLNVKGRREAVTKAVGLGFISD